MLIFHGSPVQGALFDMDGTMFDTERLRFQTLKQASQELIGQAFSDEYLMQCLGLSATTAEQLAKAQYGAEVPYKTIRQRADELELELVRNEGVPIKKGLVQVLERLRKSGLRMAVATSSRRAIAEEYLINANVYKFFDVLVCGDEVERGKPHPEIFEKAAEKLNLETTKCLMFEDSENGICSAHAAGGMTILLKDIKAPNEHMLSKANFYFETMYDCLEDLDQYVSAMEMPILQESFPQTVNQLTVGIHGFGAIGGGYIAQILSHWDGYTRPQRIIASTRNSLYREAVNAFGTYCIRYGQVSYDERIEYMSVIDADNEQHMLDMYMESSLIALCLPEHAIATEAKIIAKGLYARFASQTMQNTRPLTVLIILNKVGAKKLVVSHIREQLIALSNVEIADQIMTQHYFCDTVVNRMVSKLSEQNLYRQLKIKYNFFKQHQSDAEDENVEIEDTAKLSTEQEHQASLYIDDMRRNFQPSHILQTMDLILFNSETDMPIYVENNSPLLIKMRQMILVDNIADIQLIKNRLWNGVHAMMSWYASLVGHETIGVAMGDARVQSLVEHLIQEVRQGLAAYLPTRAKDLERLAKSFVESCQYAYKDPCQRVARDPLRKLNHNERVMGSIANNLHFDQPIDSLLWGASLGYFYAMKMFNISLEDINEHLQSNIALFDLTSAQKQKIELKIQQHLDQLQENPTCLKQFKSFALPQDTQSSYA
ncbi:HAD-IA family hydrolase [Acinetobacter sp. S40]|uniref:bifunctional mannitol-1-phosphate dehydrogenase/phosphatase n=1 Tax=unclassified Acinetobacter TaxID=196816 RepID=UPI00190E1F3A|nr:MULTISPECIES: HAD family hydrolase [unclassified Acinetobacter]MBJ9986679.1 HAD-IA family hydrolase [Acinetobacter sp. S40]MBK0063205.1 HAD-IA family hydrolase [Acinetobacter sp. S55]MBK0066883.1 HAD-IA family hydrolase [Acinetobacter sp. S54]